MSELFCQPCGDEGTQVDAAGFCLDCNEYLCQECHKIHCKLRLTRHHRLLDGKQMLKHKPEMVTFESCTDICSDHPGEKIKYYCADHDVCSCSVCVTVDHRNCAGVDHIPQVVQELADKEDWKTIDDIEPIVKRLDNVIATSKTNINVIEENDNKVADDINTFRAEIDVLLDKLENTSKEEAEKHRADGVEKMKSYIDKAADYVKKLKGLKSKISMLKEQKQDCKLLITVKEMQKAEKEMHEALEEMEVGYCIKTVTFNSERKLRACINAMSGLGFLSESAMSQVDSIESSSENFDSQENVTAQDAGAEVSGTYDKDMCVLSYTDKAEFCSVNSIAVLSDDRVVFTESANYALKMMNVKKNRIISNLDLNNQYPYKVVRIHEDKIAVSYGKGIVIVQTRTQLIKERIFIYDVCPRSFCYRSEYIYYTTNNTVNRLDMHGRKTNVLKLKRGPLQGYHLMEFAAPRTLESHGYLYIIRKDEYGFNVNTSTNSVATIGPDGSIKAEIELPNPPESIQSDEAGTVLFVLAKDVIYVIKVGSVHAQVLLTKDDGLSNAQSLDYDDKNRKLFVGMKDNNFIKVYKLSGI